MERAYMPPAEPRPFEHNTSGAPHPKAAVAGPPARTAGFDPIADHRFPQRLRRPMPHFGHTDSLSTAEHAVAERGAERRVLRLK
jgi:hypothetical protein